MRRVVALYRNSYVITPHYYYCCLCRRRRDIDNIRAIATCVRHNVLLLRVAYKTAENKVGLRLELFRIITRRTESTVLLRYLARRPPPLGQVNLDGRRRRARL